MGHKKSKAFLIRMPHHNFKIVPFLKLRAFHLAGVSDTGSSWRKVARLQLIVQEAVSCSLHIFFRTYGIVRCLLLFKMFTMTILTSNISIFFLMIMQVKRDNSYLFAVKNSFLTSTLLPGQWECWEWVPCTSWPVLLRHTPSQPQLSPDNPGHISLKSSSLIWWTLVYCPSSCFGDTLYSQKKCSEGR